MAFQSRASNLTADTTNTEDIFVYDRELGETTLISTTSEGIQAQGNSSYAAISADGRLVAFKSFASNLVPDDTNDEADIFVHNRQTGRTLRISVASDGTQANNMSRDPAISADGQLIVFQSFASNLVPDDTNDELDVFVYDLKTEVISRVSVASDGSQANATSSHPKLSADGRFVVFDSYASNLAAGDNDAHADIFVHNRITGETTRVSIASDGTEVYGYSANPGISADGRFVVFESSASGLVPDDNNVVCYYISTRPAPPFNCPDIFIHDRVTGETNRVSIASNGVEANGLSRNASISADGRLIAFESKASNLVSGDTNDRFDIFIHDRQTGRTVRVSLSSDGNQGNGDSFSPVLSADGQWIAFESHADNLVPHDTNEVSDIFIVHVDTCLKISNSEG
ncbi:MAG TPA: hypothetical protein VHO69_09430 [Phototrophicaceae bacterium]|nr:hypothetical protein [Phototrophicaceae bacterium]